MEKFLLDTDKVSSIISKVDELASEMDELQSKISGYDTSCEDGFDFAGKKELIANQVKESAQKMKNTSKLLQTVVDTHNSVQSSKTFSV